MIRGVLVETGFLLALNPRDKHHKWALNILEDARKGLISLYLSTPAILELALILKSRGISDRDIALLLESMNIVIRSYTRLNYAQVTLDSAILALELRHRYPNLTFFDSHHASLAITYNLEYIDLDSIIREVVVKELRR